MGHGHKLNHHLRDQNLHQKSTFLPILCSRPSVKDVHLTKWPDRSASSPPSNDPSSPRVSCIGQVKKSNRVIGYPTTHRLAAAGNNHNIKYSKLKRLFSGTNPSTPVATTTATGGSCCRREMIINRARVPKFKDDNYYSGPIDISEMDPPLPVIKRVQQPTNSADEVSLWKRRSGGLTLKSLQIQQIQIPNNHVLQPTTV